MQLLTMRAGRGRNRYFEIENGYVSVVRNGRRHETSLNIKDGRLVKVQDIEHSVPSMGSRIVTVRDWNESRAMKAGDVKTINSYESYGNLPSDGVLFEVHGLNIGRHKGTLRQVARGGRFVREEFVYRNGQEAYVWTPYRKRFRVYLPDGKLWMEVAAKIRRPYRRSRDFFEKVRDTLTDITGNGYSWSNEPEYEIRLYDRSGREYGYGKVENHQRVGVWRKGRTNQHFIMGVPVSKKLYYTGPDELDPREVLMTENMQLRAALMKKIGPERLLAKLPFTACDTSGESRLLKADVKSIFKLNNESMEQMGARNRLDDQIAIVVLKCPSTRQLYYLRVPPRLKKVEHARQWLCGVDIEALEEEYIRDRWARTFGGRSVNLTPSQQKMMDDEIARGRQRQRLEFVSEA